MVDLLVVAAFVSMLMFPCLIAAQSNRAERGVVALIAKPSVQSKPMPAAVAKRVEPTARVVRRPRAKVAWIRPQPMLSWARPRPLTAAGYRQMKREQMRVRAAENQVREQIAMDRARMQTMLNQARA